MAFLRSLDGFDFVAGDHLVIHPSVRRRYDLPRIPVRLRSRIHEASSVPDGGIYGLPARVIQDTIP